MQVGWAQGSVESVWPCGSEAGREVAAGMRRCWPMQVEQVWVHLFR